MGVKSIYLKHSAVSISKTVENLMDAQGVISARLIINYVGPGGARTAKFSKIN